MTFFGFQRKQVLFYANQLTVGLANDERCVRKRWGSERIVKMFSNK